MILGNGCAELIDTISWWQELVVGVDVCFFMSFSYTPSATHWSIPFPKHIPGRKRGVTDPFFHFPFSIFF
jgi:hypothetical protein